MSQQLRYRGTLDLGDGVPRPVEVWTTGTTAVAFEGAQEVGVLQNLLLTLTDDRRIRFAGTNPDGDDVAWEGVGPEFISKRWAGVAITWPSGERWTAAEVTESQYGVRVIAPNQNGRDLPGATLEVVGTQRWIVDGDTRILADTARRGCGCGGK